MPDRAVHRRETNPAPSLTLLLPLIFPLTSTHFTSCFLSHSHSCPHISPLPRVPLVSDSCFPSSPPHLTSYFNTTTTYTPSSPSLPSFLLTLPLTPFLIFSALLLLLPHVQKMKYPPSLLFPPLTSFLLILPLIFPISCPYLSLSLPLTSPQISTPPDDPSFLSLFSSSLLMLSRFSPLTFPYFLSHFSLPRHLSPLTSHRCH